ncbi:MAG: GntR family transcriptional regulator [Cohaesibacteraceae bacterium]
MAKTAHVLYRQIASELEADIREGRLKEGEQIPSERAMAELKGISRMTARKALQHLAGRGMLETRVGHGTFVGAPTIHQELKALSGFTEDMERQGRTTSSIVVEAVRDAPSAAAARALSLPKRASVLRLVRLRLADHAPVAIERTEIEERRVPDLFAKADFSLQSLYACLAEHYGIVAATAEQTIEATLADAATALQLQLRPGDPVLRQTRLTRDADSRPFEYVRSTYRGDAFVMRVHLSIDPGASTPTSTVSPTEEDPS